MTDAPSSDTTPRREPRRGLRHWAPDLAWAGGYLAVVLLCVGFRLPVLSVGAPESPLAVAVVVLPLSGALLTARRLPLVALGLAWVSAATTFATGSDLFIAHLALPVVAYLLARHGSAVVVGLSAATVVVAPVAALFYLSSIDSAFVRVSEYVTGNRLDWAMLGVLFAALAVPWLVGLVIRLLAANRASRRAQREAEAATAQALELARAREERNRLARDVHDIVGHSLAVIIAQANAVQYLRPDEFERVRQVTAEISSVARRSLAEVRQALADPEGRDDVPRSPDLEPLFENVRASGRELVMQTTGDPDLLDATTDAVVYRVVQELLTNALKFSAPDTAITVEQEWRTGAFVVTVSNAVATETEPSDGGGHGLPGARDRLLMVGGALDLEVDEVSFVATAMVPTLPSHPEPIEGSVAP